MFLVRFYVLAEIGKSSSFPIFNIAVLYFPEPVGSRVELQCGMEK